MLACLIFYANNTLYFYFFCFMYLEVATLLVAFLVGNPAFMKNLDLWMQLSGNGWIQVIYNIK